MTDFPPIVDPAGKRIPWADAAARAKGPFRPPPQRSDLTAHEADLVSDLEARLRDEIRVMLRHYVETEGLQGGRARTAALVAVAVESLALRAEADARRTAHLYEPKDAHA